MKLLQKMFFIIEELEVLSVEQFFLEEGFEVDKEADTFMFWKNNEKDKVENFLLKSFLNGFNYCKASFQEELKFFSSLLMQYIFMDLKSWKTTS